MRMKTMLAVAAATVLGFAAASAQAAEPLKIRMSYVVPVGNWAGFIYHKTDIMKHYGKSYVAESTRFKGTTFMITAMGAGELDVADLAYSSFSIAVENAGMDDLRVIADDIQDGANGHPSGNYYVLKSGPIKTIKDLKGKVMASVGPGTAVDIAIRAMLKKNGMVDKRDYTIVTAAFPSMKAMLLGGKASLVPNVHPFDLDPEFQAKATPLFTDIDALDGPSQFIIYAARESWLKKNRAAVVDWLEDMIRAAHWFQDPKNHDEAVGILAGIIKAPKKVMSYKFTKEDLYQDPNLIPNVKALQHTIDLQHDLGLLPRKLDMSKYVDLSYVKEAGARVNGK
jgi:ABC-type nitrate/sulfonate/bicarbonate transport system substrate-binding protein